MGGVVVTRGRAAVFLPRDDTRNGLCSAKDFQVALLNVRVAPGARQPAIVGRHADGIKVRVVAAPEGGRANQEVLSLLASALGVPKHSIGIVRGHTSRQKVLNIAGLSVEQVLARLAL